MFVRLSAFSLIALALVVPVVAITNPAWATSAGLDVWNVPALREQTETATEENNSLEVATQEVSRRIELKDALIQNLILGRTNLADVTDQFLVLDRSRPEYMTMIRAKYSGATDEEIMAQNVISYTALRLSDRSLVEKLVVFARLDVEFRRIAATPASPGSSDR